MFFFTDDFFARIIQEEEKTNPFQPGICDLRLNMIDRHRNNRTVEYTGIDELTPTENKKNKQPRKKAEFKKRVQTKKDRSSDYLRRGLAVGLRLSGISNKKTSKIVGWSERTVARVWKQYCNTKTTEYKKISGRPKKVSNEQLQQIQQDFLEKKRNADGVPLNRLTYAELQKHYGLGITRQHLAIRMKEECGLKNRVGRRKVPLPSETKQDRIQFAKDHFTKLSTDWFNVIFSDEVQVWVDSGKKVFIKRFDGTAYNEENIVTDFSAKNFKVMFLQCTWTIVQSINIDQSIM